jgi:hypothetical protein
VIRFRVSPQLTKVENPHDGEEQGGEEREEAEGAEGGGEPPSAPRVLAGGASAGRAPREGAEAGRPAPAGPVLPRVLQQNTERASRAPEARRAGVSRGAARWQGGAARPRREGQRTGSGALAAAPRARHV